MAEIRPIDKIADKWARVTPERSKQYEDGVRDPLRDWVSNTLKASERRDKGLQAAISDGRIDRGIKKAGTDKWQKKTIEVGINRWAEGVPLAKGDYEAGFAPYRELISKIDLPEKYPKGDPRNWERSKVIGIAENRLKTKGQK